MALLSAFPATKLLGVASSSNPSYVSPTSSSPITGSTVIMTTDFRTSLFALNVVQKPSSSSATLDVYVQHSPDNGTTFDDFVHFVTIVGSSSAQSLTNYQVAQWVRDTTASSSAAGNFQSVRPVATQALAAGLVLQGPTGAAWRAQAIVSGATSSQPWQLNLSAQVAQ